MSIRTEANRRFTIPESSMFARREPAHADANTACAIMAIIMRSVRGYSRRRPRAMLPTVTSTTQASLIPAALARSDRFHRTYTASAAIRLCRQRGIVVNTLKIMCVPFWSEPIERTKFQQFGCCHNARPTPASNGDYSTKVAGRCPLITTRRRGRLTKRAKAIIGQITADGNA
ncbi:MAG: hypothetical protein K9G60_08190 [Pseudolabrys sp.]|nr:hypothetical protein [Pseudolabrys sp.]